MMQDLDADQKSVLARVEKLLRLADKNSNEAESAAAAAKAQELLLAYNLDAALLDQAGNADTGKRADEKLRGGNYKYSRGLWAAVAELNFCLYWSTQKSMIDKKRKRDPWTGELRMTDIHKTRWHHRLVGRLVNIEGTKATAGYLEEAIERIVRERIGHQANLLFSNWAVSYRNGAAARIREKIWDRRQEMIRDEEARMREAAERAANDAARAGHSTSNAISIASVTKSEREANADFLYGEGFSARQASRRAAQAKAQREAEEEYTRWAAAHPEEARKRAEEARKEAEARERRWASRPSRSRYGGKSDKTDYSAYNAGYDAAESISIDPQLGDGNAQKKIGRR
jgi:hypothetical protein